MGEIMNGSRRQFITGLGAAAALAALATPGRAGEVEGAALSDLEKANLKLVQDFCDAWATRDGEKVAEFFAEDGVFRINDGAPLVTGRAEIAKRFVPFLKMSKEARFEVLRSFAIGNLVINERNDIFKNAGNKENSYHMSGLFWIKDGKIQEWLDYRMPKTAAAAEAPAAEAPAK